MKELRLSLRNQPVGKESTPWLDEHRQKFSQAAKEAAREMQDTPLRGAKRVRAFNQRVREKLSEQP